MNKTNIFRFFLMGIFGAVFFTSCIPANKFNQVRNERDDCTKSLSNTRFELQKSNKSNSDLNAQLTENNKKIGQLQQDTAESNDRYRRISKLQAKVEQEYDKLLQLNRELMANASNDKQQLNEKLSANQTELNRKETELNRLSTQLQAREDAIKAKEAENARLASTSGDLQKNLTQTEASLRDREKRVKELEDAINAQNEQSKALKAKLSEALNSFKSSELTVTERDGKVYVSLSQQLLFASGSKTIDPKGKQALAKLSEVLNKNTDIGILIEGHTDTDGTADLNWDLSTGRAVSIVKELVKSNVEPKRITAAGRGQFIPVASNSTAEGKAQNRRTEIILTPDLSKLYKIINN